MLTLFTAKRLFVKQCITYHEKRFVNDMADKAHVLTQARDDCNQPMKNNVIAMMQRLQFYLVIADFPSSMPPIAF